MSAKTAAACRLLVVEDDSAIRGMDAARDDTPPNVVARATGTFPGRAEIDVRSDAAGPPPAGS